MSSEPSARGLPSWRTAVAGGIALSYAAISLYLFHPLLTDPNTLVNDACQHIAPIYMMKNPVTADDDLLTRYKWSYLPLAFRLIYVPTASLIDPLFLSHIVTFLLLIGSWWLAYKIGATLGGAACGWLTLLLFAHSEYLTGRIFGGLFRSFAPLLFLLFVLCWINRKHVALAVLLVVQATMYPPMFLVCGLGLGLSIAVRIKDWLVERKAALGVLGLSFLLSCTYLLLFSNKPEDFGNTFAIEKADGLRPWSRNEGRSKELPFPSVGAQLKESLHKGVYTTYRGRAQILPGLVSWNKRHGDVAFWGYLLFMLAGLILARPKPWWWFCLSLAGVALYLISRMLAFRLGWPDRFINFALAINSILLFPVFWRAIHQRLPQRQALATAIGIVPLLGLFLLYPVGFSGVKERKTDNVARFRAITDHIASLPQDVYLTGWPLFDMDYVYLLSHRRVLVDYESAHPLYVDYYDEIRRRMIDTFHLYFATNRLQAINIRDKYGLTHLLLQKKFVARDEERVPMLYPEMREKARRIKRVARKSGLFFESPDAACVAHESKTYLLIDLRRL